MKPALVGLLCVLALATACWIIAIGIPNIIGAEAVLRDHPEYVDGCADPEPRP